MFMGSLKAKFTLTLVLTGMAVVIAFAVITPLMIKHRFIELAKREHYQYFVNEITRYQQRFGSWNTAEDSSRFAQLHQERLLRNQRPPRLHLAPPGPKPLMQPKLSDPSGKMFKFTLFDPSGRVLLPGNNYRVGDVNPLAVTEGDPLLHDEEVVGYCLSSGQLPITVRDQTYLKTLNQTLQWITVGAFLFIIPFGLYFGHRLSLSLRKVTDGVNKMAAGELQQHVTISNRDEIGDLAKAFNQMSDQLSSAYRKLEQSRDKIAEQREALRELSVRDELTGLYNRRFFNEEVNLLHANALRYGDNFCLVLGDVDHFKQINDNFSHTIGDKVLQVLADLMKKSVRDSDVVARFGGEEIILALPKMHSEDGYDFVDRIRQKIECYDWEAIESGLSVTMSFGVCDLKNSRGYEEMLHKADEQLYKAKDSGRNKVCSVTENI